MTSPLISIVMLAKDELRHLSRSLPLIRDQEISHPYEVLVIDSGSTDGSVEFVRRAAGQDPRITLTEIAPGEFHHARTRNLGMRLARGDLVVFLGGDAVPADRGWLFNLVTPVLAGEADHIAASYGRQIPREDADLSNRIRMSFNYHDRPVVKEHGADLSRKELYFFSSVNCCIHRRLLAYEVPYFDATVRVNEDITLSYRIISDNYKIVYCPDAAVIHSHNYGNREILRRYFDNAVTFSKAGIFLDQGPAVRGDSGDFLRHALHLLRGQGIGDWGRVALFLLCAATGLTLGLHYRALPPGVARRLSQYRTV